MFLDKVTNSLCRFFSAVSIFCIISMLISPLERSVIYSVGNDYKNFPPITSHMATNGATNLTYFPYGILATANKAINVPEVGMI